MKFLSRISLAAIAACTLLTSLAAQPAPPAIRHWQRASDTPILSPEGNGWESAGTFNPSVVWYHGKLVMLYRAQDRAGTSRLGYAESTDGIHFRRHSQPVFSPETDYEKDGGVEDPRLVEFDGTYYLTYTGYNKKDAQLCLATSKDLIHWKRMGVILPAYKGKWYKAWTKSGAIVPEKIDGKYWMYFHGISSAKLGQVGDVSTSQKAGKPQNAPAFSRQAIFHGPLKPCAQGRASNVLRGFAESARLRNQC